MFETICDYWGRRFDLPFPYDEYPSFFRLVYPTLPGGFLIIREPTKWNPAIKLLRSDEWHGVQEEYVNEGTAVEFDGYSGRDEVEAIFREKGEDADILLQTGIKTGNDYIVEAEYHLNLATYKRRRRKVSCLIETMSLRSRLFTRWETSAEIYSTGQIPLLPQKLTDRFECINSKVADAEQTFVGDTNGHIWLYFDTANPKQVDIQEFAAGKTLGSSDGEGPIVNHQWLFNFKSTAIYTVEVDLGARFWWAVKKRITAIGAAMITGYKLTMTMTIIRADGRREDIPLSAPIASPKGFKQSEAAVYAKANFKQDVEVSPGDQMYFYGLLTFSHNKNDLQQVQTRLTVLQQRITVSGKSQNTATSSEAITVFDAIDAAIEAATGASKVLRSPFYGLAGPVYPVSGPGAERVLVNGFGIRQFKARERPVSISTRDLLTSLQTIDAIGMRFGSEIAPTGQPRDVIEIKPIRDFYRPVELLRLNEVAEYSEEVIESELYSVLEVGYAKWVDEGSNALEEVFTTHQVTTPIRNGEEGNKKTLVSKLLTSSLAIERTRREQFNETPKDGTAFDSDVFLIQCKPTDRYSGPMRLYNGAFNQIIEVPDAIEWLTPGMTIYVVGSARNDFPFKVTFVSEPTRSPWTFYVDGGSAFSPETVASGQIKPSQLSPLTPETGADLDQITGLDSGDTTYNLRLTPGRILLRNVPIWGGCLVDKDDADLIYKSKIPQNRNLTTVIADEDPLRVREAGDIAVDEIRGRLVYRPRNIRFETRLSRQQIQRLRLGLAGLLPMEPGEDGAPMDVNDGYVSCLDETGVRVAGWVEEVEWSPTDERAVFTLRQTALDLNDTTSGLSCAQFIGWTLDQAERADDRTRRRIELCTFIDVDVL